MDSPLKAERKRRGWSQQYVGQKVGLSAPEISRIEAKGVQSPYVGKILRLVELFGYSLSLEQICKNPNQENRQDSEAS